MFPKIVLLLMVLTIDLGSSVDALAGAGELGPNGTRFTICNRTGWFVRIAIAWWGSGRPDSPVGLNSQGWFTAKPGECATVFPQNSYDSHRLYYAEAEAVGDNSKILGVWGGEEDNVELCVAHGRVFFFRDDENYGRQECNERRSFRIFPDRNITLDPL